MGQLEVIFRIGLAHPVIVDVDRPERIKTTFPETGNTVEVDPPHIEPAPEQSPLGVFAQFVIHVKRECTEEEGRDTTFGNCRLLGIPTDAAKVFWLLLETIREFEYRGDNLTGFSTIAGYPVAPAEEIQDNLLVRTCSYEWLYNGTEIQRGSLSGIPTITITDECWKEARSRIANGEPVPPYISFALDAGYFSKGDPLRGIIMACAAWETALRHYLANIASRRDQAYLVASRGGNIPLLYEFAKAAKGGPLFYESAGKGSDEFYERERKCIQRLPEWRNKLLHEGKTAIPEGTAQDTVLAVLNAIDWLFA